MGPYCKFCGTRCFVPTTENDIVKKDLKATCEKGRIFDIQNSIKEGEEYYYWHYNITVNEKCLMTGTLHKCEKCSKLAMVNGVWLTTNNSAKVLEKARQQAGQIGEVTDELCLTDDGDNVCEKCYYTGEIK